MIEIYEVSEEERKLIMRYNKKTKTCKYCGKYWFTVGSIMFAKVIDKNGQIAFYSACKLNSNYVQSYFIEKEAMRNIIELKNDRDNEYAIEEIYQYFEQAMPFDYVKKLYSFE